MIPLIVSGNSNVKLIHLNMDFLHFIFLKENENLENNMPYVYNFHPFLKND